MSLMLIIILAVSLLVLTGYTLNDARNDADVFKACNLHYQQEFERICQPIIPSALVTPVNFTVQGFVKGPFAFS